MDEIRDEVKEARKPNYDIAPLFVNRWSPRAMSGEPMSEDEFMPLFEAARWAPSSRNSQPWRFMYVERTDDMWGDVLDALTEKNQLWAKEAALLAVVASRKRFEYNESPSRTHSFVTGSAWENLALEAARREIVTHGMAGFDEQQAREIFSIPGGYRIEIMLAVGNRGKKENLPDEQKAKEKPNGRKPLDEIVTSGTFSFDL